MVSVEERDDDPRLTGAIRNQGWPAFAIFRVFSKDFVARMSAMREIARRPASTFWYGHVLTPSHLASMGRTGTVTWAVFAIARKDYP